jgi:hypothetical protein
MTVGDVAMATSGRRCHSLADQAISTAARREPRVQTWAAPLAALVLAAGSMLAVAILGPEQAAVHFRENGPIETLTPVLYVLTALLFVAWRGQIGLRSMVPPLILMLMALRELDAHKWFTAKGVISTGYYFDNPGVSYVQRLLVGLVLLAVAGVIARFFWRNRRRILSGLRSFHPYVCSLLTGFGLLALSLTLDGIGRKVMAMTGERLPQDWSRITVVAEETAELALALAFLIALLQLRFDPQRNPLPPERG